jgi:hypothetical protein
VTHSVRSGEWVEELESSENAVELCSAEGRVFAHGSSGARCGLERCADYSHRGQARTRLKIVATDGNNDPCKTIPTDPVVDRDTPLGELTIRFALGPLVLGVTPE